MLSSKLTTDYDDPAYDYQKYWQDREYEDQAEKIALKKFFSQIPNKKVIVDIGSGFGRLTPFYAPLFEKCLLVDPSKKLVREAKKLSKKYPHLEFKRALAEDLPLKSDSLDVILFVRTSHHIKDLGRAIKEFFRVLKPGGFLVFEFANKIHTKSLLRAFRKGDFGYLFSHLPENLSHHKKVVFLNYHPAHIKTLLLANGFEIKKTLSVSNFRHPLFKKLLPLKILLLLESCFSLLASHFSPLVFFGPSIFVLAQKPSQTCHAHVN